MDLIDPQKFEQFVPDSPIENHIFTLSNISLLLKKLAEANIIFVQEFSTQPRLGELLFVTDPDPEILIFITEHFERIATFSFLRFFDLNDPIHLICIIDVTRNPKISATESNNLFDRFTRNYCRPFPRWLSACCNVHTRYSVRFKNGKFCSLVDLPSTEIAMDFLLNLEALKIKKAGTDIICFPKNKRIFRFMYANENVKHKEFLFDAPLVLRKPYTRRRVPRNFIINTRIREGNRSDTRVHNQALNINYTTPLEFGYSIMLPQASFFENINKIAIYLTNNNLTLDIRKLLWNSNLKLPYNQTGCNICLSAYSSHQEIVQIGRCGHAMHLKCFHKLISTNLDSPRCIVCRQDLMLIIVSHSNGISYFEGLNVRNELALPGHSHNANI